MPDHLQFLFERIIGDAMKQPMEVLIIKKSRGQWSDEDLAYVARQTCPPMQALGAYGHYPVFYMGETEGVHRYQLTRDGEVIAEIPASELKQTIADLVKGLRDKENAERVKSLTPKEEPVTFLRMFFAMLKKLFAAL